MEPYNRLHKNVQTRVANVVRMALRNITAPYVTSMMTMRTKISITVHTAISVEKEKVLELTSVIVCDAMHALPFQNTTSTFVSHRDFRVIVQFVENLCLSQHSHFEVCNAGM